MNMGYPLLSESALVDISSAKLVARNEAAEPEVDQWNKMIPPVANYDERCFYHTFEGERATARSTTRMFRKVWQSPLIRVFFLLCVNGR